MPPDERHSPFPRVTIPQLRNLTTTAKLFVGLFTGLMLCVVFWAGWIYTVEKGLVTSPESAAKVFNRFDADPGDIHAPEYDSLYSADDSVYATEDEAIDMEPAETESPLRENLGLAHTHINGQTLLFFAIGLIFLGTSLTEARKQLVLILFAVSVVLHSIGLSGMGLHWFFDDLLAVSGVMILIVMMYMSLMIFMDIAKQPEEANRG